MKDMTRRSFLTKGSIGAVGAVGAISLPSTAMAAVRTPGSDDAELTADERAVLARPFVVHLRDPRTGELELLVGEDSIVFRNKALVAKVLRAAR